MPPAVWVGCDDAGALVFSGDERAFGEPGSSYEYWVTVAADQFDALRRVYGSDPAADVIDLVCAHAEEIMARRTELA